MTALTLHDQEHADRLLTQAARLVRSDLAIARMFMRWRMALFTLMPIAHTRAMRPNYHPWPRGLTARPHNRHDRNRSK